MTTGTSDYKNNKECFSTVVWMSATYVPWSRSHNTLMDHTRQSSCCHLTKLWVKHMLVECGWVCYRRLVDLCVFVLKQFPPGVSQRVKYRGRRSIVWDRRVRDRRWSLLHCVTVSTHYQQLSARLSLCTCFQRCCALFDSVSSVAFVCTRQCCFRLSVLDTV